LPVVEKHTHSASSGRGSLSFLLGLSDNSKVLIVGKPKSFWQNQFPEAETIDTVEKCKKLERQYHLVLIDTTTIKSRSKFENLLKKGRNLLETNGSLVILSENSFGYQNIKRILKYRKVFEKNKFIISYPVIKRILKKLGLIKLKG
jgi:hypothetical protein